jgi:hypothetical protein
MERTTSSSSTSRRKTLPAVSRYPHPLADATKAALSALVAFGHGRVCRHDRKVHFGLVDLSELEIHSCEHGMQLAVGAAGRDCVLTAFAVG